MVNRRTPISNYQVRGVGYGYSFVDKDPIMYELFAAMDASGMSDNDIADKSGVCRRTLYNWRMGKTRKPQAPTLAMVGRHVGLRLTWTKA